MSLLDDMLDEWGFQAKPGSTKGRMYSSRFYHKELKHVIKDLMSELITASRVTEKLPNGQDFSYLNEALLREKVEAL